MPIKAFALLLRWSGLRIADAVTLKREKLAGDRLFIYTAKTGTPVHIPVPPEVTEALSAIPETSEYFCWNGHGKQVTRVANWEAALRRLFTAAGVVGHAHHFRHTMARSLVSKGIPVERVSILLGHSSRRTTMEHYSSWVQSRQDQVEADVRAIWAPNPSQSKPTHSVRG
jgi:integrase/recombinase XerD